jgi:hypothetical protein
MKLRPNPRLVLVAAIVAVAPAEAADKADDYRLYPGW